MWKLNSCGCFWKWYFTKINEIDFIGFPNKYSLYKTNNVLLKRKTLIHPNESKIMFINREKIECESQTILLLQHNILNESTGFA